MKKQIIKKKLFVNLKKKEILVMLNSHFEGFLYFEQPKYLIEAWIVDVKVNFVHLIDTLTFLSFLDSCIHSIKVFL